MFNRVGTVRGVKIALLFSTAVYFLIVVLNNLTDYWTNFRFVSHVMTMDDTFPDSPLKWRAIASPLAHHIFYSIIILWQFMAGIFCISGAFTCARDYKKERDLFDAGLRKGIIGLALGMTLWLFAFLTIGGEWFLMWQSTKWNGLNDAFRMFVANGIVMSFMMLKDEAQ